MTLAPDTKAPLRHADGFFIVGEWVKPSSDAMIDVIDSGTEQLFFSVAEARDADLARAVAGARQAFDEGPWPRLTRAERAEFLRAMAAGLRAGKDANARPSRPSHGPRASGSPRNE
jgi:aldehyde dehydrogenase (NAD+)